jgi:uncharacterized protein with GYD domain
MPTYILIGTFTDQGVRNVKDTTTRVEDVRALAKKAKVTLKEAYWTMGPYDVVAIFDAPNEAAMAALCLSIGAAGNVRMQTLRAFTEAEIGPLLTRVALPGA